MDEPWNFAFSGMDQFDTGAAYVPSQIIDSLAHSSLMSDIEEDYWIRRVLNRLLKMAFSPISNSIAPKGKVALSDFVRHCITYLGTSRHQVDMVLNTLETSGLIILTENEVLIAGPDHWKAVDDTNIRTIRYDGYEIQRLLE